jgi:hypothetical protein
VNFDMGTVGAADAPAVYADAQCRATPTSAPAPRPVGEAGRRGPAMRAPKRSVTVTPGHIQAAVNQHPAGTSFILLPGLYKDGPVAPKQGDDFYGQDKAIWDGRGEQRMAFNIAGLRDVVISGIKFTHFAPPNQGAGIFNLNNGDSNILIEGCDIGHNAGTPVVVGNGTRLLNNSIHDNVWSGIAGYRIEHVIIDHNDVFNNNLSKENPDTPVGDASGMKFVKTNDVSVTNNHVHDNYGIGVWFDTDNTNSEIVGNAIERNSHRGVMVEVSYGAVIANNSIIRNGEAAGWIAGAGILVATASNAEICNNILRNNRQGITGFTEDRGTGQLGKYSTKNTRVHDNYIAAGGLTGLTRGAENEPSNLFYRNHYCLKKADSFLWGGQVGLETWLAAGQDKGGTFNCGF